MARSSKSKANHTPDNELFAKQVQQLKEAHFLILCWVAKAESRDTAYNITNVFDDLKYSRVTRTKQNVVAYIESLAALCFISVADEHNRKNLYITQYGAWALEQLVGARKYSVKRSAFLEGPT